VSGTLSGAREARPSVVRRLLSRAAARDLRVLVVPGPEIARARGLDLGSADLRFASTPRHASVLLVVGELPEGLREAAAVAYAQMPRPRAVLAAGTAEVSPLPGPDLSVDIEGGSLLAGVAELRRRFAEGAFGQETEEFEATALQSRTEYTCSMHPEVVQEEPGTCPKCGMELVPREATGDAEGDHEGHEHTDHGEHAGTEHDAGDEEGEDTGEAEHHGHGDEDHEEGHEHGNHGGMEFMSMIEMTQGTPRSSDGLQMEWVEAPFGPLFPGLPGGLSLTLTLDRDTVAEAEAGSAVDGRGDRGGPVEAFVERLAALDPLSPVAYRLLALRAVESVAGAEAKDDVARMGVLELERAASHLSWLASFGCLIGYRWLARRAEELQLAVLRAGSDRIDGIRAEVRRFARRVERTPLLRRKLAGVGELPDLAGASGPVARAGGQSLDARTDEEVYRRLDFEPVLEEGCDALARLRVRLAEVERSLQLGQRAGEFSVSSAIPQTAGSGSGAATVETPRGAATLNVTLEDGEITAAELETPSAKHIQLVGAVTEGQEVADALVGVASLDLSPWSMTRAAAG
jgi:Ni,Fe-hydrogenase III large subunit